MPTQADRREDLIFQAILAYCRFAKLLDERNRGRMSRGESLLRFDPYHGQGRVLVRLADNEGITQAKLAEKLEISPQTLSASLKKLAREGLVEQGRDELDRRVRTLKLTAAGKAVRASLGQREKYAGSMFEALDDDELQQFGALVSKLAEHLSLEIEAADLSARYLSDVGDGMSTQADDPASFPAETLSEETPLASTGTIA